MGYIFFPGPNGDSPCGPVGNQGYPCWIFEDSVSSSKSPETVSFNLVVETEDEALQLTGTITAIQDGDIGQVTTTLSVSEELGDPPFTNTILDSPVNVLEGQQILVTVEISFS